MKARHRRRRSATIGGINNERFGHERYSRIRPAADRSRQSIAPREQRHPGLPLGPGSGSAERHGPNPGAAAQSHGNGSRATPQPAVSGRRATIAASRRPSLRPVLRGSRPPWVLSGNNARR